MFRQRATVRPVILEIIEAKRNTLRLDGPGCCHTQTLSIGRRCYEFGQPKKGRSSEKSLSPPGSRTRLEKGAPNHGPA